jgi:hypothetical protein
VISPWSDHALEPYDPRLVDAAVEAACAAVGKTPPASPARWRWRLVGLALGQLGALGVALCLPEVLPRLARMRGLLLPVMLIGAFALTAGTWLGVEPQLRRVPLQIAAMAIAWLVITGAGQMGIPRWSFLALDAAVAIGCAIVGATFLALLASIFALVLLAAIVLGGIASHRGSRRDGDIAMAVIVGYAVGQWLPLPITSFVKFLL